jgi:heavy metal sensor kinase
MKRWPVSMRRRLTLWYSTALGGMLVAFATLSLYVFDSILSQHTDDLLRQASDLFANELDVEFGELRDPAKAFAATIREVSFRDISVTVFDARGAVVTTAGDARWPTGMTVLGHPGQGLHTIADSEGGLRGLTRPARLGTDTYVLAFLQSRHLQREALEELGLAFLLAVPLCLLAAAFGGSVLAHRALSPAADMARQAREIGASNLHERLAVPQPPDEVGSLAVVINDLLARLERSFDLQRRFVADASHELRTAVAIVRAESELALSRERSAGAYRDALRVTHDAGKRLTLIVDDLLLLARADEGRRVMSREPLYLDELVREVARSMRALAAERSIEIDATSLPEALIEGDVELLRRLLLNLIDNAVKYGAEGSVVRVTLRRLEQQWELRVRDGGTGIPEECRDSIFERFYRVDRARSRGTRSETSGAGLGLSIARWVAEVHGGSLTLSASSSSGSEFALLIPSTSPQH